MDSGIICFTFDDSHFQAWLEVLPLFRKYDAHVSFFVDGPIDEDAVSAMKKLQAAGHTVGLHTLSHADAPEFIEQKGAEAYFREQLEPQLEECKKHGIKISSMAYPNNRHSAESDAFLSKYFKRFRAGSSNLQPEIRFVTYETLLKEPVMPGIGVGESYHTVESELLSMIEHAAETKTCLTFFSHKIEPNAKTINFPVELLEKALQTAQKNNCKIIGFDELP